MSDNDELLADDSEGLTQEFFDLFAVVDNGDGTQNEEVHAQLQALRDAGLGQEDF